MPSICTHYLFTQDLTPLLQEMELGFVLQKDALFWGSLGPDPLLFHRLLVPGRSLHRLGSLLHQRDATNLLEGMRTYLTQHLPPADRDFAFSYCTGFLLHYALDRTAHPYVYAMQETLLREKKIRYLIKGILHNRIETNLDTVTLERWQKGSAHRLSTAALLSAQPALLDAIAPILAFLIAKVSSQPVSVRRCRRAFLDMRLVERLLHDPRGWKYRCMKILEVPFFWLGPAVTTMIRTPAPDGYWDYANADARPWESPFAPGVIRHESFFEIYDQAKADGVSLVRRFFAALQGETPLHTLSANLNFNSQLDNSQ